MYPSTNKDDTNSTLKQAAHDAKEGLNNAANDAGRKVRSMFNSASHEISSAGDKVTAEIRSNPLRSSLIALGIGAVLGALLRR